MPTADVVNMHLHEISRCVGASAIAPLILDCAGWHRSSRLVVLDNIVLMPLPPCAPELNSTDSIWKSLRENALSNCVQEAYESILDACCDALNALITLPHVITLIGIGTMGTG